LLVSLIMLSLGILAGGVGTALVRSPEHAALEAAPPEMPLSTAAVEFGTLGDSIEVDVTFAATDDRAIPSSDVDGLITSLPLVGESIEPGVVVLEISGRPVIALPGTTHMYRDLVGGVRGDDVAALQESLTSLGFLSGGVDGDYGPDTANAVEMLYEHLGYEPPAPSGTQGELRSARAAVMAANSSVAEAQASDASTAELATATAALVLATEALGRAIDASLTPLPAHEVVFIDGESLAVTAVSGTTGASAQRGAVTLASENATTLWAAVPRTVAARLTTETPAMISVSTGTDEGRNVVVGVVSWIATLTGEAGTLPRYGPAFVVPEGQVGIEVSLAESLPRDPGASLQASIEVGDDAAPAFIVPLSAIHTAADGTSTVSVVTGNAPEGVVLKAVPVTLLDSLAGRASVESASLGVGDEVVIP
jgi:peptidoglycan hydrolase-like protein with peptidoglycan-binding domain